MTVFTTYPASRFTLKAVLERYRLMWQAELVVARTRPVTQFRRFPKRESGRARLHGRLAVLTVEDARRPATRTARVHPRG